MEKDSWVYEGNRDPQKKKKKNSKNLSKTKGER